MRFLHMKFIAVFTIVVMFSRMLSAEDYCQKYENDYQNFRAAGIAVGNAVSILRNMRVSCQDNWRRCNQAYYEYQTASASFTNIFNQSVGYRCRRCNLKYLHYLAIGLDNVVDMLYNQGDYSMRVPSFTQLVKSYMHDPLCSDVIGPPPPPPLGSNEYVVWLHPKDRACCAGDWNGVAPYVYHGTLAKDMKPGAIPLMKFNSERNMIDWVCSHQIHRSNYQSRLWTKIGGYVVKDVPCN